MRAGFHPGKTAVLIARRSGGRLSRRRSIRAWRSGAVSRRNAYRVRRSRSVRFRLTKPPRIGRPPEYPSTYRDLALVVGVDVTAGAIEAGRLDAARSALHRRPRLRRVPRPAGRRGTKELGGTRHAATFRRNDNRRRGRRRDRAAARRDARAVWSRDPHVIRRLRVARRRSSSSCSPSQRAKGIRAASSAELGGAVAVTAALVTPWFYNGSFDSQIEATHQARPRLGARHRHVRHRACSPTSSS